MITYPCIVIRHMRVPIWPIMRAGSWGYLTGSWREATPYFTDHFINITVNDDSFIF